MFNSLTESILIEVLKDLLQSNTTFNCNKVVETLRKRNIHSTVNQVIPLISGIWSLGKIPGLLFNNYNNEWICEMLPQSVKKIQTARKGKTLLEKISYPVDNCWEVSLKNTILWYPGYYKSNEVRNSLAKELGVSKDDIRAKRYKIVE
jgi:hypothetical protein